MMNMTQKTSRRPPVNYFDRKGGMGKGGGSITGVSILTSYGEKPHYVKLPIFSEFMENSTKFMKNSGLTKWTQNMR